MKKKLRIFPFPSWVRRERINHELEVIQTLAPLLRRARGSYAEVKINGWALENVGKMILNAACEVRERLDEERQN